MINDTYPVSVIDTLVSGVSPSLQLKKIKIKINKNKFIKHIANS